ncbi:hypothetical protein SDC9_89863 [bioreactor metagenome]|uniref:Uncharacterized protein n=1 Tax=bioreactor metagenome TaxID=1076179 RepID=A0A644ZQE3_9ZZZZ
MITAGGISPRPLFCVFGFTDSAAAEYGAEQGFRNYNFPVGGAGRRHGHEASDFRFFLTESFRFPPDRMPRIVCAVPDGKPNSLGKNFQAIPDHAAHGEVRGADAGGCRWFEYYFCIYHRNFFTKGE